MTMRRLAALVLALLLVLFLPVTTAADAPDVCTFSGRVRLDNAEVADGTPVTAAIAGDKYHTSASTGYGYSTYSLTIRAPQGRNYPDGTKITFEVNGHATSQTATFKAGANVMVDLTASTTSTLSPSNVAIVVTSVMALLVMGFAAAYYVLVRRRGVRIADWLRERAAIPSGQALPLAADVQGETWLRYVWNGDKLAWVEHTGLVESEAPTKQTARMSVRADVPAPANTEVAPEPKHERSTPVVAQKKAMAETKGAVTTQEESNLTPNSASLYAGPINLWVESPSGMGQLYKFSSRLGHLKRTYRVRVINFKVLSGQSICFELFLQRPIPLLNILKALPEVATVSDGLKNSPESYRPRQIRSQANTRLVEVKLKA